MSSSSAEAVAPRVLAESPRARLLAWPSDPRLVAKVFLGPDGRRRALAAAAALAAVHHRHVAPLLGVVQVDGRPAVLLPRLEPRPVSELLAARGRLSAGEAVTLLVPLLLALLHVERRGLDTRVDLASGLTLDDVLLDAGGAPVIVGLAALPVPGVASVARLARDPGAAGAARRIVAEVLAITPGGRSVVRAALDEATRPGSRPEATRPGSRPEATHPGGAGIDSLIELLFDLDDPAPLEEPLAPPASSPGEMREHAASTTDSPAGTPEQAPSAARGSGRTRPARRDAAPPAHHLDGVLPGLETMRGAFGETDRLPARVLDGAERLAGRVAAVARDVRPKVWLGAAAVAASVAGGLVLAAADSATEDPLAARETSAEAPDVTGPAAASDTSAAPDRGSPATAPITSSREDTPSGPATSSRADTSSTATAPILTRDAVLRGDDATAAARVLLRLREDCLTALDPACVAGVDQADSPLLADDLAVVADPERLAEARFPGIARVAGEFGGAVLFDLEVGPDDEPASLLVTRTEAGWRLRSLG